MSGIKLFGKFSNQIEVHEAMVIFYEEWMPHETPETWAASWKEFKEGLLDTGWISEWQYKNWRFPKV